MRRRLNMIRKVVTHNQVIGFHAYPDAPLPCSYLSARHRHVFVIRCKFEVSHNNREIEINTMQEQLADALRNEFDEPCEFGSYSCEDIAQWLLSRFPVMSEVEVLEDDFGGAAIQR